ncbi:MAG: indolepyruvate ferredoxin oxidoreductase [Bacteroidales bacterium]|jgi:indolepyruvate ferredoxin oxidoreductase alpha subunit|nr:indolepyruvate ferredoxin oxidoreductase [Bacteroidales bacterium]MBQ4478412.1 indolepyruvate ferredoxin oxidoreductase [Bacteroidales bacterium]MBR4453889.1 indolepyruvate ferredoxin oxidoreductase [Bacteroidales bacterium]MCR5554549.1 indolepyruvate ferredoxin oxidoreductase [Bacteroidales bacterium]
MQKLLLLGDEAIAQAFIDAGGSAINSYPGTPSTQITEYVMKSKDAQAKGVIANWCANEKTALEASIGVAYAGKRAMTCMKHVGLNVCGDPFMNAAIIGTKGVVIVVADDPSMFSSQDEQDSRFYGHWAMIPMLEPSNQQEAYDMVFYGYEISENLGTPVLLRIPTRLAHSRAGVVRKPARAQNDLKEPADASSFVLLPVNAKRLYRNLIDKQASFTQASETSGYNQYIAGTDKKIGIITTGIAYNYLMENFKDGKCPYPVVKVTQYPLPFNMINKLYDECEEILVLEDGQPFVEELVKGFLGKGKRVFGRLDETIRRDGELNAEKVAKALGMPVPSGAAVPSVVTNRPPALCQGCPHIDSYTALNAVMANYKDGKVFGDIGCYTLGFNMKAINTTVCMGASITMAKGAAEVGIFPSVAVIGDGTFGHSGITGLLDCVNEKANVVVMILDNDITAMTGGQPSSAHCKIAEICKGLGVDPAHIRTIEPLKKNHEEFVKILEEEIAYNGVSVVIPRRTCLVELKKHLKK